MCTLGEASGIYVKSIIPGSAAYHSGQIQVNDKIVAVSNFLCFRIESSWEGQVIFIIICVRGEWLNIVSLYFLKISLLVQ